MNSKMLLLASFCFALLLICTKAHFNFKAPKGKRHLQNRRREMPSVWEQEELFPSSKEFESHPKLQRPLQNLEKGKNSFWWER